LTKYVYNIAVLILNDMTKKEFLITYGLTNDQFSGKTEIGGYLYLRSLTSIPEGFNPTVGGSLDLSSLTSIPEGFNPTVGGSLYLRSLTSIPEGFNPTVGGSLDLRSLTSIPEGFNPTVGGYLDLSSLTSIPEGFNPTVGGSLDLRSLTSIPEGFNPTVGGSLYLANSNKYIGSGVNKNFFWRGKKTYAKIDGIFCEILSEKTKVVNGVNSIVYSAKSLNSDKVFYIANIDTTYSHGDTIKQAFNDLNFKIKAEKLKKEPIYMDTILSVQHFRLITGACQMGCDNWLKENNIKANKMKVSKLLPLLEKTNAYGYETLKKLVQNG
jgi:hypothetical protein